MLYSIVGMLVIILDQLVKFWVDRNINWTNPTRPLIPGIISLVRVQNDGAAFSFLSGSGARVWFIVLAGIFALLVVIALATNFISGKFGRWCLVLVTAGGLANMIDRIRYGFVIDMFKVELFDFAVFNVADIFITLFCLAFILYILFGGEKTRTVEDDEFDEIDYEEERSQRRVPERRTPRRRDDEDDEDDERPVRKSAPKKSAAKRQPEDFDDYGDEDQPRRSSNRSAAAAAAAYRRQPVDADSPARSSRQRSAGESAPVQRTRRTEAAEQPAQTGSTQRTASPRRSMEKDMEEMFRTADPSARPIRQAAAQQRKAPAAPVMKAPQQKEPSYDADNPFAEWEKANARVTEKTQFKNYTEPAESYSPASSSDFDLDDILNEFK